MEYKIVTPMTLWQDFNPVKEPLEVTVDGVIATDKYISKEMTFTVETEFDGKIRAYANVVVQRSGKPSPTVMFLPTGEAPIKKTEFFDTLIERGFNVITVDYGGRAPKKDRYTVYPESLSYCVFSENRSLPYEPTEAASSPWFVWMKVVRRALTLACEETLVDHDKIAILGYLEGAQLAWKVAGIDGRIKGVVPVGACGYSEFLNRNKFDTSATPQFSDDWECWLAGISTQAYAKMLLCPVYYVSGTNSSYADMDRVSDLFGLIPDKRKFMAFSTGTNNSITQSNFSGAVHWLECLFENNLDTLFSPKLKTYVSDGKLYASVTDIKDYSKVEIHYALDELSPAFRSWSLSTERTVLNKDEVLSVLLPRKESVRLFVFATVIYKNGVVLSTPELYVDLTKLDIEVFDTTSKVVNRFVYNGEMKVIPFSVENYNPVVDDNIIKVKRGPYKLKGVTVTEGKLCTYSVEPPLTKSDDDYLLQMSLYSDTKRDIDIILYTAENGSTKYTYKVQLLGLKSSWQRINLKRTDFKTADRKQLKDWRIVRKMKIKNSEGVLFNNILWI